MRKSPFLTLSAPILAAALFFAVGASAETKVAVVDLDKAINATEQGKSAREELSRKKREAEATIQPLVERARALQKEVEDKKFVLSETALYEKQLDMVEMKNKIENTQKELEGQLKVDYERLVGPLRSKIGTIVKDIGKDQAYTVILEANTPGLLYNIEALDITDLVIQRFNSQG